MSTMTIVGRAVEKQRHMRHPVATTALVYLKEAIGQEHYEAAAELIAIARKFGATEEQIQRAMLDDVGLPR